MEGTDRGGNMKRIEWNKITISWSSVKDFCRKNIRYIVAGTAAVSLVVVLGVTDVVAKDADKQGEFPTGVNEPVRQMEPLAEAIPQIDTLIGSYYAAYIAGDQDTLQTYAEPISDQEKSYIALMSQFIDSYDNIKCYTKPGLLEGEYAVSVVMDVHFTGVTTVAPGLDFFYVYKDEDGTYRIDNRYSQFNLQNKELELDSLVEDFIEDYEAQDDVVALCNDVETRYAAALAADENLKQLVGVTIQDAISEWLDQQNNGAGQPAADNPGNEPQDQQPTDNPGNEPQDQQPAENPGMSDQNQGMQSVSETVYLTANVNIRKEPSETAEKIAGGVAGQSLTRTGIMSNGWSQVSYNGGTAYIMSAYLSTEKPTNVN